MSIPFNVMCIVLSRPKFPQERPKCCEETSEPLLAECILSKVICPKFFAFNVVLANNIVDIVKFCVDTNSVA